MKTTPPETRPGEVLRQITAGPSLDAPKAPSTMTPATAPAAPPRLKASAFAPEEGIGVSAVNHYARPYKGATIDAYRVCRLFSITDPAVQHAVKKLLRFGEGRHRSRAVDIAEAIQSLTRWQEMQAEDDDAAPQTQAQPRSQAAKEVPAP